MKAQGVHYTPPALAEFVAKQILGSRGSAPLRSVLDPACGDGELLVALLGQLTRSDREHVQVVGYDLDPAAAGLAEERILALGVKHVELHAADFLEQGGFESQSHQFDVVISNPPYVRTQTLGAPRAQELARRFGITGRVDLYHSFVIAITAALSEGGTLGLITSNRFLMVQSGAAMRGLLASSYRIHDVFDLGDTKLFGAAVLPAVLVATRCASPSTSAARFSRIYEAREPLERPGGPLATPLELLESGASGRASDGGAQYDLVVGELHAPEDPKLPWTLRSAESRKWLASIAACQEGTFGDFAAIRVGIKTTADAVFIRDDWVTLRSDLMPEPELLRPLLTHQNCERWSPTALPAVSVLYPHEQAEGERKRAVDLALYPQAAAYLKSHRARLESRKYVIEAGRQWYEIWVPQAPVAWKQAKLVYPDISEFPRFALDLSGAVVNGDCYWITLRPEVHEDLLYVLLGVANSEFIVDYYDARFHNKLYAGRRRFMTQYVREFPVPMLSAPSTVKLARAVRELVQLDESDRAQAERDMNELVWSCFGVGPLQHREEVVG